MRLTQKRVLFLIAITIAFCFSGLFLRPVHAVPADSLPTQISDAAFWQLITDLSEPTDGDKYPGGNNFTTNETPYQAVIPELLKVTKPGGVYFGVAPEQNFTYITATQPKIAFIIDLRRQNMIELLMYKALFEASADRAEFVSRLFGLKRPSGIGANSSADALFKAYGAAEKDQALYDSNLQLMKDRLIQRHGFKLSAADIAKLEFIDQSFFRMGPKISFAPQPNFPTYTELMTQTDGHGTNRSFLANEANFRIVKALQEKNLIVPLVGDFTGSHSMRALGQYVKDHGAIVNTIYASTVEYILFMPNPAEKWRKYYENLALLPIGSSTTLIRGMAITDNGLHAEMLLQPVGELVKAFAAGQIKEMKDVIQMSQCGDPASARYGCHP